DFAVHLLANVNQKELIETWNQEVLGGRHLNQHSLVAWFLDLVWHTPAPLQTWMQRWVGECVFDASLEVNESLLNWIANKIETTRFHSPQVLQAIILQTLPKIDSTINVLGAESIRVAAVGLLDINRPPKECKEADLLRWLRSDWVRHGDSSPSRLQSKLHLPAIGGLLHLRSKDGYTLLMRAIGVKDLIKAIDADPVGASQLLRYSGTQHSRQELLTQLLKNMGHNVPLLAMLLTLLPADSIAGLPEINANTARTLLRHLFQLSLEATKPVPNNRAAVIAGRIVPAVLPPAIAKRFNGRNAFALFLNGWLGGRWEHELGNRVQASGDVDGAKHADAEEQADDEELLVDGSTPAIARLAEFRIGIEILTQISKQVPCERMADILTSAPPKTLARLLSLFGHAAGLSYGLEMLLAIRLRDHQVPAIRQWAIDRVGVKDDETNADVQDVPPLPDVADPAQVGTALSKREISRLAKISLAAFDKSLQGGSCFQRVGLIDILHQR
ncbi:MAG: hypothetical protein AAFN70_12840, partial [Planctomycetota bacterium]